MIRPIALGDTPTLLTICDSTGLFPPEELAVVEKLLDDYHRSDRSEGGPLAFTWEVDGTPVGVAYVLPREMTDRTWELLMIMVHATRQGQGVGSRLLTAVVEAVRAAGCRLLLAETSATPDFEPTRQFYRKNGFTEVATVPDYYAEGVGKTTLTRPL